MTRPRRTITTSSGGGGGGGAAPTSSGAAAALCPHAHRAGPCPHACTAPDRCIAWGLGAAPARPLAPRTTLAATLLHLAVAFAAAGALVLIVKTAAGA